MPKHTLTLAAATLLLAACNSSAPTDPSARSMPAPSFAADHTTPGTPGDPNCSGQTTAYLAQASKNGVEGIPEGFRGLGGVSRATGLSQQEIKAIVDAFCTVP
jgi:hypothetical protein